MKRIGRVVLALLRELADETAYKRYLAEHGRPHSREEWRKFSDRRLQSKYTRAKCC